MASSLAVVMVKAALRRLQPPAFYSSLDSSGVVRELDTIALPLAEGVDVWLAMLPALVLEAPHLLERWEAVLGIPVRPGDTDGDRAIRIRSVLQRNVGYSRAQLARLLAPVLGIGEADVIFVEATRSQIDLALTRTEAWAAPALAVPIGATPLTLVSTVPWPNVVDEGGVMLHLDIAVASTADLKVTLKHQPWGISKIIHNFGPGGPDLVVTVEDRALWLGARASGPWLLVIEDPVGASGAARVREWSLTVSNDDDSRQIYQWYVRRDPALLVTTDLAPAQLLLERTGIAHARGTVCEQAAAIVNDPQSLCDREAVL